MARVAAAALLACGCAAGTAEGVGLVEAAPVLRSHGELAGLRTGAMAGFHGVQLELGASWQRLARPETPSRYNAGAIDLGLGFSPLEMFADDHRFEHWFDFGFDARGGGGLVSPGRLTTFGQGSLGAWATIGLWSGDSYPVLVLGVRSAYDTAPWTDETLFTVGVGWMHREIEMQGLGY